MDSGNKNTAITHTVQHTRANTTHRYNSERIEEEAEVAKRQLWEKDKVAVACVCGCMEDRD